MCEQSEMKTWWAGADTLVAEVTVNGVTYRHAIRGSEASELYAQTWLTELKRDLGAK